MVARTHADDRLALYPAGAFSPAPSTDVSRLLKFSPVFFNNVFVYSTILE